MNQFSWKRVFIKNINDFLVKTEFRAKPTIYSTTGKTNVYVSKTG